VTPLESRDCLAPSDVDEILSHKFDALVVGNGLGRHDDSKQALKELLVKAGAHVVLDADGVSLCEPEWLSKDMVVTPHAAEFARLFRQEPVDRVGAVEKWAEKTGATLVLKGDPDVISNGETTRLNKTGNPAMTVGGTGDALAGAIAGLLAQSGDLLESACAGCFLTGLAGDLAFERLGVSMTATDVIEELPEAIKFCGKFWG